MPLARSSLVVALLSIAFTVAVADDSPKHDSLHALYKSGTLFDSKHYKAVRSVFSKQFHQKHEATIRLAFGDQHADLTAWLDKHPDIREELYTAIDEQNDNVRAALGLFASLWKEFPKQVETYPGLAIATAIVWDKPRGSVYDYRHHQVRTRSKMPEGLVEGRGNFEYLINAGPSVTSQLKVLPREFLTFVVDHQTPIDERKWAQKFVVSQRGTSSWHQSIAYDHGMLETEMKGKGPGPKLAGHDYSLQNIKKYGGVCAQQADFVARVGKSVGQPAVYVVGESSYRGLHAWVMWVSIVKPSKDKEKEGVKFNLVSDGRTRGFEKDAFYVGFLNDPQTGKRMLDRDMERRLTVVGIDARVRRQSALAMRAYSALAEELKFEPKERLAYLERVWQLSPYSEEAWRELARLAKAGELSGAHRAVASAKQPVLLKTFARWPDFVAAISNDLRTVETTPAAKVKLLSPQVAFYEKALRPDLACIAQLEVVTNLREQKKHAEAAKELTRAVRKFPTEGRYVPQLLKAFEAVVEEYPQAGPTLANLYVELAPALVKHYKGERNKFLDQVLAQGQLYLDKPKFAKQAKQYAALVAVAKSSK